MYDLKIVRNYSEALFANAIENKIEEKVLSQVTICCILLKEIELFKEIMFSPIVENASKFRIVLALSEKLYFEKITTQFLNVIIRNARPKLIMPIIEHYQKLLENRRGIKRVSVVSSAKLGVKEIESIKQFLEGQLQKIVELQLSEDHSLIGGVVVKYDSNLLDYSVLGAINKVEKIAKNAKV